MTYLDNSPVRGRSSAWSEWSRRCQKRHPQKRYWCFWIMAALFPFTVFRMVYLCNISSIKEESSDLAVGVMESEGHRHSSVTSIRFPDISTLRGKSFFSHTSPLIRTDEATWTTLHKRASIENNEMKHGKKIVVGNKRKQASKSNGKHTSGQLLGMLADAEDLRLPEDNEEYDSAALVEEEKHEDRPIGEYSTQEGERKEGKSEEKPEAEQSIETQDGGSFGLPESSDDIDSVALVNGENQNEKQEKKQIEEEKNENQEKKQIKEEGKDANQEMKQIEEEKNENQEKTQIKEEDKDENQEKKQIEEEEKPTGEHPTVAGNTPTVEERHSRQGEDNWTVVEEALNAEEKMDERHDDGGSVTQEVTDHTESGWTEEAKLAGKCDLFDGDWVWDPEGPLYTNSTCFYMQGDQNCMSNGRLDTDYLHWKWKPRDCDLPRFDARAFLEMFKGKTIGFAGDSLARNQMQSVLCMLAQIEVPRMVYQSDDDSTVRWLYEQHQVTLGAVWSPYLLKESREGIMGFEKGQSVLYLDVLDTAWTSVMRDFDVIVLSIGQWYFKGSLYVKQDEVVGCHYCSGFNFTEIGHQEAYRAAIRQVLGKVAAEFQGIAIMSTFAISHFEGGRWDHGGQCRRERPLDEEEAANFPEMHEHTEMHDIVMDEFNSIAHDKSKMNENVKLELLDVTKVSLTRADGHPGPYRNRNPYEGRNPDEWVPNDCLHWCLPGPVDTWNQLLVKIVNEIFTTSRNYSTQFG